MERTNQHIHTHGKIMQTHTSKHSYDYLTLQVEVVGFAAMAAHADTSDCILMLNRLFSVFDEILDLHGVHKVSHYPLSEADPSCAWPECTLAAPYSF